MSWVISSSLLAALRDRRQRLARLVPFPVLLWAGDRPSRNFPANPLPFRASSHFLYFVGAPLAGAVVHLAEGCLTLFLDEPPPESELWHGPTLSREAIAAQIGAEAAFPLEKLADWSAEAATIPVQSVTARQHQSAVLGRSLPGARDLAGRDRALAEAVVQLRLAHDEAAIAEIRQAVAVTVAAHQAGMAATPQAATEAVVRAAMESVILAHQMTPAYPSIVTIQGEVLHNEAYHHPLRAGDLLLVDVGAETPGGWAADVTRTWPVSGRFSPTQRSLYDVVLAAHDACIAAIAPGVEYREIHLLGARAIAVGLVDLGILRGDPDSLVEQDAHALFFPHGIGHLLGLDVHDMEDLGDLAGYAPGRQRSDRFGLGFLRCDRPLQAGMVVTIEPGFYQVPALLQSPATREKYASLVNWERLTDFADVRGIRIEDDVWVTPSGPEVLTAALPTEAAALEALGDRPS